MDCIIEIKGILCTGGKASIFRKSQLSKICRVLVWVLLKKNMIKQLALYQF